MAEPENVAEELRFSVYEVEIVIEGPTTDEPLERFLMIETFPAYVVVVSGDAGLLREFVRSVRGPPTSRGPAPASREWIDKLMVVNNQEEENSDAECAICLENLFEKGKEGVVKQTPCKHRFHGKCLDKWLCMHGSCPMCRYKMSEEEGEIDEDIEMENIGDSFLFWIERAVLDFLNLPYIDEMRKLACSFLVIYFIS